MQEKPKRSLWDKFWGEKAPLHTMIARSVLSVVIGTPLFYGGMAALPGRPLRPQEIDSLRRQFNASVDLTAVRVNSSPVAKLYTGLLGIDAVSFNNNIFVGSDLDGGLENATGDVAYELIHEMKHVIDSKRDPFISIRGPWQTALNFLSLHGRMYQNEYELEPGKKLDDYNIEQRASIVADYFNIRQGEAPLFLRANTLTVQERDQRYWTILKDLLAPQQAPGFIGP